MSDEKKQPLSLEGWIKLYTDEIIKVELDWATYLNLYMVILVAFLSAYIVFVVAGYQFWPLMVAMVVVTYIGLVPDYIRRFLHRQSRLKPLINTREAIISGERADYAKIQSEWKAYMKKYYSKYLENSEMNIAVKESCNQKGEPQVPQSDIMLIKESLQEIKDVLESTKIFSVLVTLGSFFIAIGIFVISLGTTLLLLKNYYAGSIVLIVGTLILISGGLMISSAEPYIGALKGRLHGNILFFLSILILLIAGLIGFFANLNLLI